MKIVYIAKHDSGGNDDEGAITHALQELGHDVQRLREFKGTAAKRVEGDLYLFHNWQHPEYLNGVVGAKAFWYFDLVDFPDKMIRARCQQRLQWIRRALDYSDVGFCTDGNYVNNPVKTAIDRIVKLEQGADERRMPTLDWLIRSQREQGPYVSDRILFTGIQRGGAVRESFVEFMKTTYGPNFYHVPSGVHGERLMNLVASSKFVVAPDGPVTDYYWSNRVYLTLGFGGFLLHPRCEGLERHYSHCREIVYYNSRDDLVGLIEHYREREKDRHEIAQAALERTRREHTYRHRVERLLAVLKERKLVA